MNTFTKKYDDEIDIFELAFYLLSKWRYLVVGLLLGALLSGARVYVKPDTYMSSSMVFVLSKTTTITSMADLQVSSTLSDDFIVIAKSNPVIDSIINEVEEKHGTRYTREYIKKILSVTNMTDTRVLRFMVTCEDPQIACDVSNAAANIMRSQISDIMKSDEPTMVEKAEVALEPVDKNYVKFISLGGMIGLVLVAILWTIPYLLDDRIVSSEEVEEYLGKPVMGVIPFEQSMDAVYDHNNLSKRQLRKKRKAERKEAKEAKKYEQNLKKVERL